MTRLTPLNEHYFKMINKQDEQLKELTLQQSSANEIEREELQKEIDQLEHEKSSLIEELDENFCELDVLTDELNELETDLEQLYIKYDNAETEEQDEIQEEIDEIENDIDDLKSMIEAKTPVHSVNELMTSMHGSDFTSMSSSEKRAFIENNGFDGIDVF